MVTEKDDMAALLKNDDKATLSSSFVDDIFREFIAKKFEEIEKERKETIAAIQIVNNKITAASTDLVVQDNVCSSPSEMSLALECDQNNSLTQENEIINQENPAIITNDATVITNDVTGISQNNEENSEGDGSKKKKHKHKHKKHKHKHKKHKHKGKDDESPIKEELSKSLELSEAVIPENNVPSGSTFENSFDNTFVDFENIPLPSDCIVTDVQKEPSTLGSPSTHALENILIPVPPVLAISKLEVRKNEVEPITENSKNDEKNTDGLGRNTCPKSRSPSKEKVFGKRKSWSPESPNRKVKARSRSKDKSKRKRKLWHSSSSSDERYSKKRCKSRSSSRSKSNVKNKKRSKRSRSRNRNHSKSRDRSRSRDRSWSRDGSWSRDRSRSRARSWSRDRSRSRSRHRSRSRNYEKNRNRSRSRDRSRTFRSRSPKRFHYSRHVKDRSRSRSRSCDKIDKPMLLEIARKNALNLVQQGLLPPGIVAPPPDLKPDDILALKSGGKSVKELTDFCKKLSEKPTNSGSESGEESTKKKKADDEEEEGDGPFIHHPFKVRETQPNIILNIRNAVQIPIRTAQEKAADAAKLHIQFPVSSGSQHRVKELEWVPVDKKNETPVSTAVISTESLPENVTLLPDPPLPPPPTDSVFPAPPEQPIDIGTIVSERLKAVRRLQDNPHDVEAIQMMYKCQQQMQSWAQSKQLPGQFLGSTGATILRPDELSNPDPRHQAWVKKDQLNRAAPLQGGVGMYLLQKMGWKPGEGLGKNRAGTIEPLTMDVKTDKKGLVSAGELTRRQTFCVSRESTGKHPVSALMELCNRRKWEPPDFTLIHDSGPDHKKNFLFKVCVNGKEYQPCVVSSNKKHAKAHAAVLCLQDLGIVSQEAIAAAAIT